MKTLNIALCSGRHEIPQATDGAIFGAIEDVTNINALDEKAAKALTPYYKGEGNVNVYVTGLTVALVSVINVACSHGVNLTLWHYNAADGSYYPQYVATRVDADLVKESYGGYSVR